MKHWFLTVCLVLGASGAAADIVVPIKTIRANTMIVESDLGLQGGTDPNAYDVIEDVVGQETRRTLYAGRPILIDDIGPPAVVERNQIVSIEFNSQGLSILTEGRSLERGGVGDRVRIMNLSSRATLFGQVQADGSIKVLR